jgi:hypothetical protein
MLLDRYLLLLTLFLDTESTLLGNLDAVLSKNPPILLQGMPECHLSQYREAAFCIHLGQYYRYVTFLIRIYTLEVIYSIF